MYVYVLASTYKAVMAFRGLFQLRTLKLKLLHGHMIMQEYMMVRWWTLCQTPISIKKSTLSLSHEMVHKQYKYVIWIWSEIDRKLFTRNVFKRKKNIGCIPDQ